MDKIVIILSKIKNAPIELKIGTKVVLNHRSKNIFFYLRPLSAQKNKNVNNSKKTISKV